MSGNGEIFYTLREAQIVIESWRRHYNTQQGLIKYRWAENRIDRLPELAAELVRRQVNVIVATGVSCRPRSQLCTVQGTTA
jgi:hypothetical protein